LSKTPGSHPTADAKADLGFTLFTLGISGPDYDLGMLTQWLKWRDARNG
jgi:hypothetical protein